MNTPNFTKVRLMAILNELDAREITIKKALATISKIENILKEHENTPFIIGKTDNPKQRDASYDSKKYHIFEIVFSDSSLGAIDEMEKCLIRYFKVEGTTADDITNENDGGAGRKSDSLMYYIYVAVKTSNNENN